MSEQKYIEKKRPDPEGLDFEGLKKEGLRLLQELCGKTWTDYNLHDPGVTILEHLCYALTDLMYRTEFDTADYLTGKDGSIDFEKQALFRPQDIFPSQPITINDYRKIIFDAIPEIDNVWVRTDKENDSTDTGGPLQGLYRIHVKLKETVDETEAKAQRDQVIEKVEEIYTANRNLCEDLKNVRIVEPRHYSLHADVEIDGTRDPVDILAEIYFKCSKYIAAGIVFYPYEEMLSKEQSLEEIFTGPLTEHGYIKENELDQSYEPATISNMIGIISNIDGVRFVNRLCFEDDASRKTESITYDPFLQSVPCLRFPRGDEEVEVRLFKGEKELPISLNAARVEFDRLNFKYQALRYTREDIADLTPLPKGEFRNFREYYSIQNHFPEIYGINPYGVPDSAPAKRKAQARQLKAYLFLFEQIMSNFLENLQEIPRLFSLEEELRQSYFHQVLSNKNLPNVEELYDGRPDEVESKIGRILARYDKFGDRRNRILDYLLGIYGENFTQSSLRRFNYYHTDQEPDHVLIRNKLNFLKHIIQISQKRAGAFNYRKESWNTDNISGFKKKVGILTGLKYFQNRSLTDVFVEKGLELISDEQFKRLKESALELEFVDLGDIDDRVYGQFHEIPPEKFMGKDERRLFKEIVFLKNNVLNESILKNGIDSNRFKVGSLGDDKTFQIVFKPYESERWYYLASYDTEEEAVGTANDLRRFLINLNLESEGVHIVEHILLRALSKKAHDIQVPDDFYSFRISVIFPSWTARFKDKEFRKLAEETVRLNCPAHVYPEFYWLDFKKMHQFEERYKAWLTKKCSADIADDVLDDHSKELITFLLEHNKPRS